MIHVIRMTSAGSAAADHIAAAPERHTAAPGAQVAIIADRPHAAA
jgi:hypothetical protein